MYFNKIAKVVFLFITLLTTQHSLLQAKTNSAETFDWGPIMDAITQVESEGNSKAVNGLNVGAMQIRPILVKDCNAILKSRGESKRYTLNDRFNVKKSREMFVIIMSHYNPTNNVERAIRMWNGGVKYTQRSTQRYYNKVMSCMK